MRGNKKLNGSSSCKTWGAVFSITILFLFIYLLSFHDWPIIHKGRLLRCSWQPCSAANWYTTPKLARVYDALGMYYEELSRAGLPTPVLIAGQARHLYVHGTLNPDDSDTDLGIASRDQLALVEGYSSIFDAAGLIGSDKPMFISFNPDGEEMEQAKFQKYGMCECSLPNGKRFACMEDIVGYLSSTYGSSWWVDLPDLKSSIMFAMDDNPVWVSRALNSLYFYDTNSDGTISPEEIANQTCTVPEYVTVRTAHELTGLLIRLSAISDNFA